jgi:dTDP-4-amino-4,6-dideoxygalactose transaminase
MVIPLSKPYVDQEIKDRVLEVIDSGQYILGEQCREFEKEFAQFIGVKHAILTSSGTSAIFLCLKALGIGMGDGVLVPSLTAFPTIEPILHVGAKPIFIDVDDTFTMDSKYIEAILSVNARKVKCIMPVHLYGHPADMDSILDIAKYHGFYVVEDCCQAPGARYKGKRVGSIGIAGCFSFYPSKNLTVLGDGGMITTSDEDLANTCRMLRDHGRREKYKHEIVGYNMRFNEIQASVGRIQLRKLDSFNEWRRRIAGWYDEGLEGTPVITPKSMDWAEPVYHLYVIRTPERDKLSQFLKEKGIQTGIHYPIPSHKQKAISNYYDSWCKLTKTEEFVDKILSLPMYPELEKDKVDYICESIKEFFDGVRE